jgi:hypothetical protein
MVACIGALLVYPVIHFVPSRKARIPAMAAMFILVGLFGWRNWPKKDTPNPQQGVPAPSQPTINQTATDSECSNFVAGSDAQIKCLAEEKARHAKDKPHP